MSIQKKTFGSALSTNGEIDSYVLTNASGMTLEVIPYGCRVTKLMVPDKTGKLADVILGHATLEEYKKDFQGTFVGRYANRIGGAAFAINGKTYALEKNDGENSLHGGPTGFAHQFFDMIRMDDSETPSITFGLVSEDGHEGFPGKLTVKVTYQLTADNEWKIRYEAETDKETIFNPTQHAYFNLSGNHEQDVLDTEMQIHAEKTTPVSAGLIPTGELVLVESTALDFREAKLIGQDIAAEELKMCGGFDHNLCVEGSGLREAAVAYHPASGRVLQVFSDMPGIQLYTANTADGKNKDGSPMKPHCAFCLETQYYPDSPNQKDFPFSTLKPGEKFVSETVYQFSVR
ncbi:aldose epimerase family protein [Scatolibacter rhodanostii]|uniref:aldose epimerase family protein n=1 Tax=Scatolibacter rhodanostii TaxID=2014781 RepID=UPI000C069502|nr:aldose epimerase family protein [Scatolibacter rhodanostii]